MNVWLVQNALLHRLPKQTLASQEDLRIMEIFSSTDHELAIQKTNFRREERCHGFPEAMLLFLRNPPLLLRCLRLR